MTIHLTGNSASGIDERRTLLALFIRKLPYIIVFTSIIAFACYAVLARLSPQYRAEATVQLDMSDTGKKGIGEEVMAAQLQLLRSHDLARTVSRSLGLERRAAFASAVGGGPFGSDFMSGIGLRRDRTRISPEERTLEIFAAHLSVSASDEAPVIVIAFTSADPELAADVANAVATEYVALQAAARDMADDATRAALARRQSGFLPVDARILSRASAPVVPSFPQKGPITAVVASLALFVMSLFASLRALARRRHRDRIGGVPIPEVVDARPAGAGERWKSDGGVRRIMPAIPTFADSESDARSRDLVASLARRLVGEGARRIMVVTAVDEVVKFRPLAAVALARALARTDRRPVLIDLRGDGADSLSMGEAVDLPGFSDLFAGEASFGQVIFRDRKSRVHFIPAGLRRLPRQELADPRIGLLVSALDHTYDHVVFDVAGDIVAAIGAECDMAVVATAFDRRDARTASLVERVQAHSQAKIVVFQVVAEAGEPTDPGVARVAGAAA